MKLLQRTVRTYLIYSLLVVLVAIPVFYIIIHLMFMQDVDNVLHQRRDDIVTKLNSRAGESDWAFLQYLDENILIQPLPSVDKREDTIYDIHQYDKEAGENEPFRILSSAVVIHNRPFRLVLRQSLIDSEDLSQGIVVTQAILLLALLSGLLLINRYQSGRIWRPFYTTLEKLRKFELDKQQDLSLGQERIREFTDLNQAITQLVQRSYQVYLHQKMFTENAAHEMQTPLAIFRSKLDLLLQNAALQAQQAELIQSLSDAAERLSRLNRSLLLLARIENRQYLDRKPLQPGTYMARGLALYEDQAAAKKIQVDFHTGATREVMANPELVEILVSNLVSNAINHNIKGGWIRARINENSMELSNSGTPLPFSAERIFDRFQKDPASAHSNGLGLAIVREICEVSGFVVSYSSHDGAHVLTVRFSPDG